MRVGKYKKIASSRLSGTLTRAMTAHEKNQNARTSNNFVSVNVEIFLSVQERKKYTLTETPQTNFFHRIPLKYVLWRQSEPVHKRFKTIAHKRSTSFEQEFEWCNFRSQKIKSKGENAKSGSRRRCACRAQNKSRFLYFNRKKIQDFYL